MKLQLNLRVIRYVIVAVLAYVVDLGGFVLLLKAGLNATTANVLVKIAAAIFGFFMHRRYTYSFSDKDGMAAHAVKYFGLAAVYTPASTLVLYGLLFFTTSVVWAKVAADVILFVATYAITTSFVFTAKRSPGASGDRPGPT